MTYGLVTGSNFSGRTDLLRQFVGLPGFANPGEVLARTGGAYVGDSPTAEFLGFAANVEQELNMRSEISGHAPPPSIMSYFRARGLLHNSPYRLSGGEQALLAVGAALCVENRVALDTSVEQLSADLCQLLGRALNAEAANGRKILICDNRIDSPLSAGAARHVPTVADYGASWQASPKAFDEAALPARSAEVKLHQVRHAYGRRPVLINVQATLSPGNVYHLRGSNGAGKTTLAKILAGLLKPTRFQAAVNGRDFRPWRRPSQVFAYHFQNPDHQFFRQSVRAELDETGADEGAVRMVGETFGISDFFDKHPLDAPFAIRKRIALAATILLRRPWTILDEPTLGQDFATGEVVASVIGRLVARGWSFVVITHNPAFMASLNPTPLELVDGTFKR